MTKTSAAAEKLAAPTEVAAPVTSAGLNLVIVERRERVGLIMLNRPKQLNALNRQLAQETLAALQAFDADPGIGAIVITGSNRAFAAGADIEEMAEKSFTDFFMDDFLSPWDQVRQISKPILAAVGGFALGGGCELALACDLRIAADNATFGQPEILLGIIPGGGGTQRLPRAVGVSRAKELMITGRQVRADEALRIGLADEVVAPEALHERAFALAAEVARGAVSAQALVKHAVDQGLSGALADGLLLERRLFTEVFATDDAGIGVRSFLEHGPGKATFTGR